MSRQYFGTDGIRGRVGQYPITADFMLKLGWAAGRVLGSSGCARVVIGKDTRISGYMFESALEAGLSAAGVDILLLGPMPTPAIAYLTRTLHACSGIVISASHNPYYDNGIKFFSSQGFKLPEEVEAAIETELDKPMVTVDSAELGKAERVDDARGRYIEFCKSTIPSELSLRNLKIVVDCANGAGYHVAPSVLDELGADVIEIGAEPDGLNINQECGSTSPEHLQEAVVQHQADIGIALDGDGDRVLAVDHKGEIVDGDELLYIIVADRHRNGRMSGGVVGTLMTNLGLEHALRDMGVELARAAVGDRYVMEMLQSRGWKLGGESSGHIICLDRTTTGDGIVSILQVLAAMVQSERSLHEMKGGMRKYPQHMINVPVAAGVDVLSSPRFQSVQTEVQQRLGDRGRILVRPSGTEPVIRVMVEADEPEVVVEQAEVLASAVSVAAKAGSGTA